MNKQLKHAIGVIMILLLMTQIMAINKAAYIYKQFSNNQSYAENINTEIQTTFVSETIRWQQRYMLSSLKQTWAKYIESSNEHKLIANDNDDFPIYSNGETSIGFNPESMIKVDIQGTYCFNIIHKDTKETILTNARPKWNLEKVEEILSMLVAPLKTFGNEGGFIVYDSNSGEIFLDTTLMNRTNNTECKTIFNDVLLANNKNPQETGSTIQQHFTSKKDSNNSTNIVYMFNEPTLMGDDQSNFEKYPLGQYKRQFVEKAILPYETIGFDGQPMQLTILSIVDEQDITSHYTSSVKESGEIVSSNIELYNSISAILILSILGTMIIMILLLYTMKNCNDEK